MPICQIGEKRINYWIARNGLLEGRKTILFVHGAGGGQFTWSYQKGFFEKEFNPVIIELPGHGESGGEGEKEIGRYAEHVYSFVKAAGLGKVFLVGHSMGGAIVQTLALAQPEIMEGIVLVGTGARLKVFPMVLDGIRNDFEQTVSKITQFAFSKEVPPELIERGVTDLMRCRPEVLYGDFLACDRFDLMERVKEIEIPALILCGKDDEMTPVKYSQFLHGQIHGSRLEILPDAGHMVMMESPRAFNERVRDFIMAIGSRGSNS